MVERRCGHGLDIVCRSRFREKGHAMPLEKPIAALVSRGVDFDGAGGADKEGAAMEIVTVCRYRPAVTRDRECI
jgi:hypothetical protein